MCRFTRLWVAAFVLGSAFLQAQGDLVISEFMADNQDALADGFGQHSDWIEIHNPTATEVNLAGWQLRAGSDTWAFPSRILPAGGYMVVFASGATSPNTEDPQGNLHASFKLSAEGESLALLNPEGKLVFEFPAPVPRQREDISYGLLTEQIPLVDGDSAARILVPDARVDEAWRGGDPFDDTDWLAGKAAAGFHLDPGPILGGSGLTIAYRIVAGTIGTQSYGGALGMDFEVKEPVLVTALGVFDDGADGLRTTLTAQLWRRDSRNTPTVFTDDTGAALLAKLTFIPADPGLLEGGSRFKTLATPLLLTPGSYTIVASGYNDTERNGNAGTGSNPEAWETDTGQGALEFVGTSRYGDAGTFPRTVDTHTADRYAAGTFKFTRNEDSDLRTDLAAFMPGQNSSALLRIAFTVPQDFAPQSLLLRLGYDDGFAVWINGVLIAQRNTPVLLNHQAAATQADNGMALLTMPSGIVRPGTNILALQGLNVTANDRDFIIAPHLTAIRMDPAVTVYFRHPTPGQPNDTEGVTGFASEPECSPPRGFYETPLAVTLTTRTPGVTLRYTLDGSTPSPTRGQIYTHPIPISTTTVLRALADQEGIESSAVVTHTYLFLRDVAVQTNRPSGYPTSWAGISAQYGIVTNTNAYARAAGNATFTFDQARAALVTALRALPTLCLATDRDNLFNPTTGLYLNPAARGEAWERPVAAELILPDGSNGFQVNAGLQIMGWTSRSLSATPKLNFRLLFERKFGVPWLRYPFFGAEGAPRFNSIALRANSRDSWAAEYAGAGSATYLADQWAKEAQLDMGQLAIRGRFVHLYLNGLYWGIYNPTERPDAAFVSSYRGGERDDYDIIKFCCPQMVEDGSAATWNELLKACNAGVTDLAAYQRLQGNRPDGTRDPALPRLIDVDNFIDYVINGQFHASVDWPGNYYVGRYILNDLSDGFQFFQWDNDLAFSGADVNANKVRTDPASNWWKTSPGAIDIALRKNTEYRLRFADHVYRHLFNDGALTTRSNLARWNRLATLLEPALFAESARWGSARGSLRTVQDHWRPRHQRMVNQYFPARNAVVLSQLRSFGLYPKINAPEYEPNGGVVPPGQALRMIASAPVYFTLDGSDPRLLGGAINPTAQRIESSNSVVNLTAAKTPLLVRSRAFNGAEWSALHETQFIVGHAPQAGDLIVSEMDYHPAGPSNVELAAGFNNDDDFEFLELANVSSETLALTGLRFINGIEFHWKNTVFPTLASGECLLLVANRQAFLLRHGPHLADRIAGTFANGTHLNNAGEPLTLVNAADEIILDFTFGDDGDWPVGADGLGATLVLVDSAQPNVPASWRASLLPGGTPGVRATLYEEWRQLYFTATAITNTVISGNLADPDGDGAPNLLEFAVGTNPNQAEATSAFLRVRLESKYMNGQTLTYFVLSFQQLHDPSIEIGIETSSDLQTWQAASSQFTWSERLSNPSSPWAEVTYSTPLPSLPNGPPAFWRLRVNVE